MTSFKASILFLILISMCATQNETRMFTKKFFRRDDKVYDVGNLTTVYFLKVYEMFKKKVADLILVANPNLFLSRSENMRICCCI